MSNLRKAIQRSAILLDNKAINLDFACNQERSNWVASRYGLPAVGSSFVNRHGIKWTVREHGTLPTYDTLHRWREGDIQPGEDLYPVIAPSNFSPRLIEFINAIDRCTTKAFAIVDTMPGRRNDGHVPGGNHIDTVCHPATNVLFLDAARVNETIIAHEFGHAWVQYVDECEDLRTIEDSSDPQRMRQVGYVQSFVLDLKVNDLLRRKGFDMSPIEDDQAATVQQLAHGLALGYEPQHPREEVFMSLLLADEIVERDCGRKNDLAKFDHSLSIIRDKRPPLADLAEKFAESVRKHGYASHEAVVASIDECLLASFQHSGDGIDLDGELVLVNPEEPDIDKFPEWLQPLSAKTKAIVGKHMARNEIASDWLQQLEQSVTGRARVWFLSPDKEKGSEIQLLERIGPPNRYSDLPDDIAELLALKHLNETKSYQPRGGPAYTMQDLYKRADLPQSPAETHPQTRDPWTMPTYAAGVAAGNQPSLLTRPLPPNLVPGSRPARPYMAGTGRFLTAARLQEQLQGEHPYAYAENNPISVIDPSGLQGVRYDPGFWNSPGVVDNNNCYSYACDWPWGRPAPGGKPQPGDKSGGLYNNFPGGAPSCANIIANAKRDGLIFDMPRGGCPRPSHKVCLYITQSGSPMYPDYHWLRQDDDGYWSSKHGLDPITRCYTGTNVPITNPDQDARQTGYGIKCGCFCSKGKRR